jgi:uncharacterized protein YndB with AHSA1/START domain
MSNVTTTETRLEISRTIDAPRDKVYRAFADPAKLARWFAPGPLTATVNTYDLRAGGTFEVDMADPEGAIHKATGTFHTVEPGRKVVMDWRWADDPDAPKEPGIVTVTLEDAPGGKTKVTLVHERLPNKQAVDSHTQGWTGCLDKLAGLF